MALGIIAYLAGICISQDRKVDSIQEFSTPLIVKSTSPHDPNAVLDDYGLQFSQMRPLSGGAVLGSVTPANPNTDLDQALSQLRADNRILYAVADNPTETTARLSDNASALPNDPLISEQWHLGSSDTHPSAINLYDAWRITHGDAQSVVAVLDTGVRYEHPDMTGRLLPGYDFVQSESRANDGDGRDDDAGDPGNAVNSTFSDAMRQLNVNCPIKSSTWHGTAMASLIAANSDDNYGMAGIDRQANILPVRVVGRCGGLRSDLLDAIRWSAGVIDPALPANPTPARIISISLSINEACSAADQSAIDDAVNAGAIVVVGVGNDQTNLNDNPTSPSTCNNVLSVAALKEDGTLADYSNYGTMVDIAAPGGDDLEHTNFPIVTASNQGNTDALPVSLHRTYSGTSVATPIVSGVLSLMLSIDPGLSNTELVNIITMSTREFPGDEKCNTAQCGSGMLDANLAVRNTLAYSNGSRTPTLSAALAAPPAQESTDNNTGTGTIDLAFILSMLMLTFYQARAALQHKLAATTANKSVRITQ